MEEINLYDLMRFYARKWLTIATVVMIGAILGVIYTFFVQQPQYKSTATLLLVGTGRTSNQESVVLNNYVQLFESRRILEPVIAEQKYDATYDKLAANTTAENVKNTDIINVSISTSSPKTSKALLEAAILKFREEAKTLYGDGAIKINVVDAADVPTAPTNVKPLQQIGLAIAAAFALAIVALFFIYDYTTAHKTQTKAATDVKVNAKAKTKATPKKGK
jgi:capsular polysaccharide biosynthesis protein